MRPGNISETLKPLPFPPRIRGVVASTGNVPVTGFDAAGVPPTYNVATFPS